MTWLNTLVARQFVGTESRLLTLFDLLRQISEGTDDDPDSRRAKLLLPGRPPARCVPGCVARRLWTCAVFSVIRPRVVPAAEALGVTSWSEPSIERRLCSVICQGGQLVDIQKSRLLAGHC